MSHNAHAGTSLSTYLWSLDQCCFGYDGDGYGTRYGLDGYGSASIFIFVSMATEGEHVAGKLEVSLLTTRVR